MTYYQHKKSGGLGKQAKVLSDAQIRATLAACRTRTERVMVLLSVKAGMRAREIAGLTWAMVCDAEGKVGDVISLLNTASKGPHGGREIPMHPDLHKDLVALMADDRKPLTEFHAPYVLICPRGRRYRPGTVTKRFERLYRSLGFQGCSSHSGRRTFITRAARKIVEAGGSLRDVQQLAGHASLSMTQVYIEGSSDAKRRVVSMI